VKKSEVSWPDGDSEGGGCLMTVVATALAVVAILSLHLVGVL